MATPRAGRSARLMVDTSSAGNGQAVVVALKNKWSLDGTAERLEVTSFGDATKTYVQGLPDASGSFSGFWDADDTTQYNLFGSSVARKFYLYPDFSNDATTYFFCTAFFSVSFEGDVGGVIAATGSWSAATSGIWVP